MTRRAGERQQTRFGMTLEEIAQRKISFIMVTLKPDEADWLEREPVRLGVGHSVLLHSAIERFLECHPELLPPDPVAAQFHPFSRGSRVSKGDRARSDHELAKTALT